MKTHFLKLGLLVALIFIIFNCSKPVPTQELVKARQSIEELQNRNPEGKSKEILDRAIQELKSAHEKLPEEDYDVSKKKSRNFLSACTIWNIRVVSSRNRKFKKSISGEIFISR
jgi:hypothetical protein